MTRNFRRIARLGLAGSVALSMAVPALSLTRPDTAEPQVQAWSAMRDVPAATLLDSAEDLPLSDMAVDDQPYCAENDEIQQTLSHDFAEKPVDQDSRAGAELWGSSQMGTWTLVAARADDTSCIIASGIGYRTGRDVEIYYVTAGLR